MGGLITPHSDPKIPQKKIRAPSARGKLFLLLSPLFPPGPKSDGLLTPPPYLGGGKIKHGFQWGGERSSTAAGHHFLKEIQQAFRQPG